MPKSHNELANALRALSMDAVQKANSGHPGAPMGMADIATVLWRKFFKHNPADPNWLNRDRFVLSNGHGSMLQYALLHLSGYDLSIDDLKQFRQLHSKTPGHPELGDTPGVETTTGPLGQGLANGVGMALAEAMQARQFNRAPYTIIDHYTYVFVGDGCLMEGISHEVCSLAGTWHLGKLIVFYDDNGISIDGEVHAWFTDDTVARFQAYSWHVIADVDGHDPQQIEQSINTARQHLNQPSLICCKTQIGYGAPTKAGSAAVHGAPLGADEIQGTRQALNWPYAPFEVPDDIYHTWNGRAKGHDMQSQWQQGFGNYQSAHPPLALALERRLQKRLPNQWQAAFASFIANAQSQQETLASRKASQKVLDFMGTQLPELVDELLGGSADLTGSNLTKHQNSTPLDVSTYSGNYLYYGVREFGMSAIANGIALHSGFIPYVGTFLVFVEYARNAIRMAALMKQRVIFIYTHDSIGLGEDGPTHQPVEQMASLRMTPNISLWRPCDMVESAVAWKQAIEHTTGPTALIFSRQNLVHQPRNAQVLVQVERGGYVLLEPVGETNCLLIATGSEVALAMECAQTLNPQGYAIRVVSMPSCDTFDRQAKGYREAVLPPKVSCRIAIEAGISDFWWKYTGLSGRIIGMNSFGASAPANELFDYFGFNKQHVCQVIKELLGQAN